MENVNSMVFYASFYEAIKGLSEQDQLGIYNAIFTYVFTGEELELSGVPKSIFTLIQPQIVASANRYSKKSNAGAPLGNQNARKKEAKKLVSYTNLIEEFIDKITLYNDIPQSDCDRIAELINKWLEVRDLKKCAMTEESLRLNIKKIPQAACESCMDIIPYLEEVIRRGYPTIYSIKNKYEEERELGIVNSMFGVQ